MLVLGLVGEFQQDYLSEHGIVSYHEPEKRLCPCNRKPLSDPTDDPSGRSSGFSQKHVKHLRLRRKPYGCKTKESLLYPGYCCGAADAAFRPPAADAAAGGHPTP